MNDLFWCGDRLWIVRELVTNGYQDVRRESSEDESTNGRIRRAEGIQIAVHADRSLIRHACVTTLLGLVLGLTTGSVKAPTAALEAHTIGVL